MVSPSQRVHPPIQGLFIPVQDSSSPSPLPSVVTQSLGSMMSMPSPEASSSYMAPTPAYPQSPHLRPGCRQMRLCPLVPEPPSNILLPATAMNPNLSNARSTRSPQQQQQPQPQLQSPAQLSLHSIFPVMPFLLRLRSPPSDLLNMTCTSGELRTRCDYWCSVCTVSKG